MTTKNSTLTQERLKEVLSYNPDTGIFTWITRRHGITIWDVAGCKRHDDYIVIGIDGCIYLAHRLAWLYVYGEFPVNNIDHISGHPKDNRIINLRDVPYAENSRNQKKYISNTSGITGVTWDKVNAKWRAKIKANGKHLCLGRYKNLEDAAKAREIADIKYGFHPNHGSVR